MPWQNNNGGGWKSGGGGGGPWGQGPQGPWGGGQGGNQNQPDIEEMIKRGQDRLKNAMPGGTGIPAAVW